MTMPKWTGSMPAARMTGSKSGVSSRIADSGSMTQPIAKSSRLMTIRISHGGSDAGSTQAINAAGTWLTVSSHENTPAQAMMMRIWAEKVTVARPAAQRSRSVSSRNTSRVTAAV